MKAMKTILLCACGAICAGPAARAALPNPIAYFSFDEIKDGVVADLSGNGRDLTVGSGCSLTNDSAVGSALWLDGTTSTYATFKVPELKKRTISLWYKRSHQPGAAFEEGLSGSTMPTLIANLSKFNLRFSNNWASASDHTLGVGNNDVVACYGAGGTLNGVYFSYNKYPQVYPERWSHLVWTIEVTDSQPLEGTDHLDTFNARFYVNGELWHAIDNAATTNAYPSQTAVLGNNATNGTRPCRGALDEFKVFDQYLSADQVREEYERCKATANRFNLVAWYPFQEFSEAGSDGSFTTPDKSPWGVANGRTVTCSGETSIAPGPRGTDRAIHFQGTANTHAFASIPFKVEDFTMAAWVNVSTNTTIVRIAGQSNNFPRLITYGAFSSYYLKDLTSLAGQYTMPGDGTVRTFDYNCLADKGDWQYLTWVVRNVRTSTSDAANTFNQVLDYYVNGELMNTSPDVTGAMCNLNTTLVLGSLSSGTSTRVFEGDVSDFRFYAGAMTADEVKALYRGAATVDAGEDAVVAGSRAVLKGAVGTNGGGAGADGYSGEVSWSLVSSPAGGEAAEFLRRDNPVTEVTLPVEGEYVFRLAATGLLGASQSDTVKVTRSDATGEASVAPAADVAAAKQGAALRASLSEGLVRHWKANGIARREEVSKTVGMTSTDWSLVGLTNGVTGFAFMSRPGVAPGGVVKAELTAGETAGTYGSGYEPANEWLAVSAWIRPEAGFPSDWYSAIVVCQPFSFNVCFGQWWRPAETAEGALAGFSIQQVGIQGFQGIRNYDLPAGTTMEGLNGTWSHVVALINRHETSQSSFYLNGVKLAENESRRQGVTYGTYTTPEAATNFSGKPAGGRHSAEKVTLLNANAELGGVANNINFCASNTVTGVRYSRHFPGAVDEVRFYNRKLTEDEIAYLFAHPDLSANEAPVVAKATSASQIVKKRAASVAAESADDGNGTAAALEYEWRVVKGDATKVVFADPNAAETTVTVNAKGSYAFLLRVSDGERTTSGEPVEVEVVVPGIVLTIR